MYISNRLVKRLMTKAMEKEGKDAVISKTFSAKTYKDCINIMDSPQTHKPCVVFWYNVGENTHVVWETI